VIVYANSPDISTPETKVLTFGLDDPVTPELNAWVKRGWIVQSIRVLSTGTECVLTHETTR
jgi:hypothetical protein